jgi:hypothetical protein
MCRPSNKEQDYQQQSQSSSKEQRPVSGWERKKHSIERGLLFLSLFYSTLVYLDLPLEADGKFCDDGASTCRRADLIAYKVTAMICMFYMGLMGTYNWYFSKPLHQLKTPEDRLFGFSEQADAQNIAIFCYQVWDLAVSVTIPEHREGIFLMHHLLAAITAFCSLEFQMVPYYSVFFGGCSELSSIFLVLADTDQMFPLVAKNYSNVVLASQALFTLSFTYFRVFGWIYHSFPLWKDVVSCIKSGSSERHRPGKTQFLYVFLTLDTVLGALQLFWMTEIVKKIADIVSE